MSSENKVQELKKWCEDLIKNFRIECDKLDESEKSQIPNNLDFRYPCQIEFFWVDEPVEYQLFVTLHDPDTKDGEIFINGPCKGYDLFNKLIEIMDKPRWKKKMPYEVDTRFLEYDDVGDRENKYSDALIPHISNFYRYLRMDTTVNVKEGEISGQIMSYYNWCSIIKGNIVNQKNPMLLISESIKNAKQQASYIQNNKDSYFLQKNVRKDKNEFLKIIGAYYYPTIRIGDNLELSFQEKLTNSIGSPIYFPQIDSEFSLNGIFGFFDSFGFIGIQTDSKKKATQILNTIFGVSLILGFDSLSVRESELSSTKRNSESKSLGGFSWQNSDTKRPSPYSAHGLRKTAIPIDSMKEIIDIAEKVLRNDTLNDSILFLLESYTHLHNSEYSPSFIFSWFIIEKRITQLFDEMLSEKDVSKSRQKKYENHGKWSSDTKIEVLNFCGKITNEDHQHISKYNKMRNDFVHQNNKIDKDESIQLFEISKQIVKEQVISLLKK